MTGAKLEPGYIRVYSGPRPPRLSDPPTGELLFEFPIDQLGTPERKVCLSALWSESKEWF